LAKERREIQEVTDQMALNNPNVDYSSFDSIPNSRKNQSIQEKDLRELSTILKDIENQ
jgi:hypothetical protein